MVISKIKAKYKISVTLVASALNIGYIIFMYLTADEMFGSFWILPVLSVMLVSFACVLAIVFVLSTQLIVTEKYLLERTLSVYGCVVRLEDIKSIDAYDNSKEKRLNRKFLFANSVEIKGEKTLYIVNNLFCCHDEIVKRIYEQVMQNGGNIRIGLK